MASKTRLVINLEPETMYKLKAASEYSGLPMTTYARILIHSGLPAIDSLVEVLEKTNAGTMAKIKLVAEALDNIRDVGIEGEQIEKGLRDEHQYELAEEFNNNSPK